MDINPLHHYTMATYTTFKYPRFRSRSTGLLTRDDLSFSAEEGHDVEKSANPDYKLLVKRGKVLPVLPYHVIDAHGYAMAHYSGTMVKYNIPTKSISWIQEFHIPVNSDTPLSLSSISGLYPSQRDMVLNKARAGLAQHIDDVSYDSIQDIGEAHKSARMFRSRFDQASDYASNFKKKNESLVRSAKKFLATPYGRRLKTSARTFRAVAQDLNNMYLEFNFGWKPIYSSIQDASIGVAKYVISESRQRITGYSDFRMDTSVPVVNGAPAFSAFGSYDHVYVTKWHYEVWIGGLLVVPTDNTQLSHNMGLDVSNVPRALWDLANFSFIADYFGNIGDFIDNISYQGRKLASGSIYQSEKLTYEARFESMNMKPYTSDASNRYYFTAHETESESRIVTEFRRTPITSADTLVRLNFHAPLHVKQVLNILSVAAKVSRLFQVK